jgi:hypothetical protein
MQSKKMANAREILFHCQNTTDLKDFYSSHSLGGDVEIQSTGKFVVVQTFPYSGVRASHLIVYAQEPSVLTFVCFLRVQTQDVLHPTINGEGVLEIHVDNRRVAAFD